MKLRNHIFFLLQFSFVLFNLLTFADETPLQVNIQSTLDTLTYTVSFPQPELTALDPNYIQALQFENIVGELRQVEIPGCPLINEPGSPLLPRKPVVVVIPPEKTIASIQLSYSERIELPGDYTVPYGLNPTPIGQDPVITYPNLAIYNTNQDYPQTLHSEFSLKHKNGYSIVIGDINPVQYNPVLGKVYYYSEMTLVINLQDSQEPTLHQLFRGKLSDRLAVANVVENPGDLDFYDNFTVSQSQSTNPITNPDDEYEYVVITSLEFADSFTPLIQDKIQRGISATVVTTEEIYEGYAQSVIDHDEQWAIRDFIIDAYQDWQTEYVLLAGDADQDIVGGETEAPIVPSRNFIVGSGMWGFIIAADMYYSCLDGTFDSNENGYFGELWSTTPPPPYGNDQDLDFFAEVAVGRAPCDSLEEVYNFVTKSLNAISVVNFKNVLLVGDRIFEFGTGITYGSVSKEQVHLSSSANGYTTVGFASDPNWNVETIYDTATELYSWFDLFWFLDRDETDEYPLSIINFDGIGDNTYAMKFNTTRLEYGRGFPSPEYFLLYSQASETGDFDNCQSAYTTFRDDSFAERILGEAKGAFAVVANSRDKWTTPTGTPGATVFALHDRQFFDAYFAEGISELGPMLNDTKEDLVDLVANDVVCRYAFYEINLLGDPELAIDRIQSGIPHIALYSQEDEHYTSFSRKPLELEMYLGNWNAFVPYQFNIEGLKESSVGPCAWEISVTTLDPGNSPIQPQLVLSQSSGEGSALINVGFITTYQQPGLYSYLITVTDTTNNVIVGKKTININVKPAQTIITVPGQYSTINQAVLAAPTDNDTFILVSPGIYNEGTIDLAGKNIHLKSTDGRDSTTIIGTIYTKQDGLNFTLDHKTIIEGFTIDANSQGRGIVSWCKDENNSPNIPTVIIKDNIVENGFLQGEAGAGILIIRSLATIKNNIITNNHIATIYYPLLSQSGAGIYFNPTYYASGGEYPEYYIGFPTDEFVRIERNLIYGNTITGIAWSEGGGMNISSNFIARNNTVVNNTAIVAAGVNLNYTTATGMGYDLKGSCFINNIVYGNNQGGDLTCTPGGNLTFLFISYNCLGNVTPGFLSTFSQTNFNIYEDPLFIDPTNNNYLFQTNSPAIDAGAHRSLFDPDGTLIDLGYYQYIVYVPYDYPTIRQAIDSVPQAGGAVFVDNGIYNEGALYFNAKPIILNSLNGAENTTIIGSIGLGSGSYQGVFPVNHSATIEGFTIDGDSGAVHYGPGIESVCSENNPDANIPTVTIKNNIIKNCTNSSGDRLGGGICLVRSNATVEWNQIYNNNAAKGGGIYFSEIYAQNYGYLPSYAPLIFNRNLIYDNNSDYGAGVYAKLSSPIIPPDTGLYFLNNTITDNVANQRGGGVYTEQGRYIFRNNIIWDNLDPLNSAQLRGSFNPAFLLYYNDLTYSGAGQFSYFEGNIATDPLLTASYQLQSNSPCIDTGDPDSLLDPDYTQADMGVYYYPHSPPIPPVGLAPNAGEEIGPGGR